MEGLPIGYTLCEYIESDGRQYIDTGFVPDQDTRIDMEFSMMSIPGPDDMYFSVSYGSGSLMYAEDFGLYWWGGKAEVCYGHEYVEEPVANAYDRLSVVHDRNEVTITNLTQGTVWSRALSYHPFVCHGNLCLSATREDMVYYGIQRIYSCRIYDNGELVRDYVPCQNPEGVYGLYDKTSGTFHESEPVESEVSISPNGWHAESNNAAVDGYTYRSNEIEDGGYTVMRITFSGLTSITFTCWYDGEDNYDYLTIGALDSACTRETYETSLKGSRDVLHDITYKCDNGTHFVEFCYSKDGSYAAGFDCAYVYVSSIEKGVSKMAGFTGKWAEGKELPVSPVEFRRRLMPASLPKQASEPMPYARLMDAAGVLYRFEDLDMIRHDIMGIVLFCEECEPRLFSAPAGLSFLFSDTDPNYSYYNSSYYTEEEARADYDGYRNSSDIYEWAVSQGKMPSSNSAIVCAANYSPFMQCYRDGFLESYPYLPSLGEMALLSKYRSVLEPFFNYLEEGTGYMTYEENIFCFTSTMRSFNLGAYATWGDWWAYFIPDDWCEILDLSQYMNVSLRFYSCGIVNTDNVVEYQEES